MAQKLEPAELKIKAVIGFSGKVIDALHYSPCGKYIYYPLGSFVVVKDVVTEREAFLDGHSMEVSCITVSRDGKRLASGQVSLVGVKADVIIWDLDEAKRRINAGKVMIGDACVVHRLRQHLSRVQGVAFSCMNNYISTLGGQDDNSIVIWDVATGEAICGSPAAPDASLTMKWLNERNDRLVTAGKYNFRVWQVDVHAPKIHAIDAKLGAVRRVISTVAITPCDHYAYCGTTSGDILKVKIDRDEIRSFNDPDTLIPSMMGCTKDKFAKGVSTLLCVQNPETGNANCIVGGGDGTLVYINPNLNRVAGYNTQVMGGVTSISLHASGKNVIVGTDQCNRYVVSIDLANAEMKSSCHNGSVNDIAYPEGCPDLIVTSSKGDIRVWNTKSRQELLRIQVPTLECFCSVVSPTGGSLISGWDDGKIRAFYPETGRMKFVIPNAHADKVTAIAIADNDAYAPWRLVSGGEDGKVRVWKITSSHQALLASMKEHRGVVNCIKVNKDGSQAISASADGCCIVWDLDRYVRLIAFYEPNIFMSVLYHPDESQMLTCGTNHKITYWDSVDGQAIRVIDGGDGFMTALDVDPIGEFFISGSEDKLLKIWHYDDGLPVAIGRGHSGSIKAVKMSPDQRTIVSVGSTGEILFWDVPPPGELRGILLE